MSHSVAPELTSLRRAYRAGKLDVEQLPASPHVLLAKWLSEAVAAEELEPNAMALSTVNSAGKPTVRFVLLKGLDELGLRFFTNYASPKAQDIEASGVAAVALWWPHLERQVRVEGSVSRLTRSESEAYFRSRPRGSQLGAHTSQQSQAIASRSQLEAAAAAVEARFAAGEVPLPDFWGGYLLTPERWEFWQGRESRLHDRFSALRSAPAGASTAEEWLWQRLAP